MSFFSSLQQYVTSGVAGLGLSPRRFSRQESGETAPPPPPSADKGNSVSHVHGFPKVVPPPGTVTPPQAGSIRRKSRALECLAPPRTGSFRQRNSPVQPTPPDRPPLAFCRRRLSWPEVDLRSTSGVQESDGSYFESFTALSWKRENRRMSAMRAAEARAEVVPEKEREQLAATANVAVVVGGGGGGATGVSVASDVAATATVTATTATAAYNEIERADHKEQLYVEVLYTIANTVGAPAPGGQFAHYKEEMYLQAQRAFGVSPDRHYRLLHAAAEENQKIIVLSVVVQEADGLEAKDANGFSDPYCMLGIQPAGGGGPSSPQPVPLTPRTLSAELGVGLEAGNLGGDSQQHDKLRKHHSFRLSFKRKEGTRREHRGDSLGGPVPAKFIRATTIKSHTLSPKWSEKFKFDIDDINTDTFHLDIWDHDDESCVLDAVSHLNEVRGVRGLGRFFKQVCQSARQGSQDDFLGCVNIPIADIPSTGLEGWFKLEARSQRSTVQGRIRLKLWLSTREDRGTSEEDNSVEMQKLERLQMVFMAHELATHEPSWTWSGELPGPALTALHQMAVQGDLSDLQRALTKFVAAVKLNHTTPIDPKFIHRLLIDMDRLWGTPNQETLTQDLEQWLADAMTAFVETSLSQIRRHREIFPAMHSPSLVRLEFLLRCLGLLGAMKAFRQVCPFNKGVRGEIVSSLRKGSVQWAQHGLREAQRTHNVMVHFTTTLIADLQQGLTYYHALFDNTNGIQYFSIIYKQFDAMLAEEVSSRNEIGKMTVSTLNHWTLLEGDKEPADTRPFELYLALQEFATLKQHLSVTPQPPEKPLALQNFHAWFEPAVQRWLTMSKARALQRVRAAIALDRICEGERIVRHSTSSVDTASCFYQLREFWRLLQWPDQTTSNTFEAQLIDAACSAAVHYGDLVHQTLADGGYYEQQGPFRTTDEMCVTVNNLEYVRRSLSEFRPDSGSLHDQADILLESSLSQMETRADRVLAKLGPLMQAALHKAVFHLAWSPDSLPTNQAIVPLLEYLDMHLSALNSALLTKNFNRSLTIVWATVLGELTRQMDTGGDGDRPTVFHDRLYEALHLLIDFFNAEGLGLAMETLQNDTFWRVEQRLQYHKTETDRLIDLFYMQRLQEQLAQVVVIPPPYGVMAVRAYFNHDSLCVEVLHARDIIPLDPNGFSDPFVIVELLPRRVFTHCAEQQTNVHKKTLNPIFDECFEFSVTLDQCQNEVAMIAFTVMDHDVLTANDFAGEAFLALGTIPGVADYNTSVDNFHGLKQVDLPLMQQHDKNHPILQILESRITEKQANDFVRKQKARLAP